MRTFREAIRPLIPFGSLFVLTTVWVLLSRNDICSLEPRMLFVLYGTVFSNICVRTNQNPSIPRCWTIFTKRFHIQTRAVPPDCRPNVRHTDGRVECVPVAADGRRTDIGVSVHHIRYGRTASADRTMDGLCGDGGQHNSAHSLRSGSGKCGRMPSDCATGDVH